MPNGEARIEAALGSVPVLVSCIMSTSSAVILYFVYKYIRYNITKYKHIYILIVLLEK